MALTPYQFEEMLTNQMSGGKGFAALTSDQKQALKNEVAKYSGSPENKPAPEIDNRQKAINSLASMGYTTPDESEIQGAMRDLGFAPQPATKPISQPDVPPAPEKNIPEVGKTLDQYINDIISSIISSGKTVNPNLTEKDLAELDPSVFLQQAENSIAPEYRDKFQTVKDNLTRELTNVGYDLTKKIEENKRITKQNLETGTEELAGRGLAFSGQRTKFEQDTTGAQTRADEADRTLAFRSAQETGSEAEQKIGTSALQNYSAPQIEGRQPFSFSTTPLTGSLTSERQYLKESMAKELEQQERSRRAYSTRQLAFA